MKLKLFGYILELKKKGKRKSTSRRRWTVSETNTALRLVNEGKSRAEIASMLNRTEQSVNTHLWQVRKNK